MAIDRNQIETDITLEVNEEVVSAADFKAITKSFLALVEEVSKSIVPNSTASSWAIKVYPGSYGLGLMENDNAFNGSPMVIVDSILSGLDEISSGHRPRQFSDRAIENVKKLGSAMSNRKDKSEPDIKLWQGKDKNIFVGRKIAENAAKFLAPAYEEDGSVEGTLDVLDGHGHVIFYIYDVIDKRQVRCIFDDAHLAEAHSYFKQRVEVIGSVKFRSDGIPVSIKADRIVPFPKEYEIPTLEKMRAIFRGEHNA